MRRHLLILGDQLNRDVAPLSGLGPEDASILMVESDGLAASLPHHKQKLVLVFSAMRHFADALRQDGFEVTYRRAPSFENAVSAYVLERGGITLEVMRPSDWGYADHLAAAADAGGGRLTVHPNGLWLTAEEEFDDWARGRNSFRMEHFYRRVRARRGWLMVAGEPAGGRWNFDADNRRTPEPGHTFPPPPVFHPSPLTLDVMAEVDQQWPEHFGEVAGFAWPVTREDALRALEDFLQHRLAGFGPYEDAMVEGQPVLYHSLLSVPLNLGLLHPLEVCQRALAHAADPANDVPLQSIEGFIRQILGWREFIRHVYRHTMPGLRNANGLEHHEPLPALYWGGPTRMRCLDGTVRQLSRTGHTHHIQRLMVLGNFALIAGVDPRQLNDWFLATHVDALDWVVTPNVMGMSQFADLGSFTTKPYAASGKYIQRMSDHCRECPYDPGKTVGSDACPMNSLYWAFLDRHQDRLRSNPRMALMFKNWARRDADDRAEILGRADEVRAQLRAGSL